LNFATDHAISASSVNTELQGKEFVGEKGKQNGSKPKGKSKNKREGQSKSQLFKKEGFKNYSKARGCCPLEQGQRPMLNGQSWS